MKLSVKALMAIVILFGSTIAALGQTSKNVTLNINNMVGDRPLVLNEQTYTNSLGEKFNITTMNYFISNIRFRRKDRSEYVVPQDSSYFLVREVDSTTKKINLTVPEDEYTAITFMIGVDSLRSTSDLKYRAGALDISGGMIDGMYWTWNSGYIFFKLEGTCEAAKVDMTGQRKFRYHIGGFGGYNKPSLNNLKVVTIDLSEQGIVDTKKKKHATVNFQADALKVFNGKTQMSIAKDSNVMFGNLSKSVADNYSGMFSHVSTSNK
jgi:hypothetical protein